MKISPDAWHYRMLKWAWGPGFFWKCSTDHDKDDENNIEHWRRQGGLESHRKRVALCPYVDFLILGIVLSPIIALGKLAAKGWELLSDNIKSVVLGALIGGETGFVSAEIWHNWFLIPIFAGGTWLMMGIIVGMGRIYASWSDRHPRVKKPEPEKKKEEEKPPKPVKEKHPNILLEWLRAKHRKICPLLEFG